MKRKYKVYSVLRNLAFVALGVGACALLCGVISLLARMGVANRNLADAFGGIVRLGLAIAVLGSVAAIVCGCCSPYESDIPPAAGRRRLAYVLGSIGGLIPVAVVGGFAWAVVLMFASFGTVDVICPDSAAVARKVPRVFQKDVPKTAKDVHFKSGSVGIFQQACFSCKISEADFVRFAQEKGYPLGTNVWLNANADTKENFKNMDYGSMTVSQVNDGEVPKRFLAYAYIFSNCGGTFYVFDRDAEKLYYHYSTN